MIEALLKNENIPIGAALLVMVIIMTRYMAGRDTQTNKVITTMVENQQEISKDATQAIKDNTVVMGRMEATLSSMDRTMRGVRGEQ